MPSNLYRAEDTLSKEEVRKNRISRYKEYLAKGLSQTQISEKEGISHQAVGAFIREHISNWREYQIKEITAENQAKQKVAKNKLDRWGSLINIDMTLKRAISASFITKKNNVIRAKKKWEWDLKIYDLVWPTHCPYLGIELDYFATERHENSISFDRIDSKKGYVKGNVIICSWRANRIKNDAALEELGLIYHNLKSIMEQGVKYTEENSTTALILEDIVPDEKFEWVRSSYEQCLEELIKRGNCGLHNLYRAKVSAKTSDVYAKLQRVEEDYHDILKNKLLTARSES